MAARKKSATRTLRKKPATRTKPATRKTAPRKTPTRKTAPRKTATQKPATRKTTTTRKTRTTRKKSARTKAQGTSAIAPVSLAKLPIVWRLNTGSQAAGLWVADDVWAANDRGEIFQLTKEGETQRSYKLPKGVTSLLADDVWRFAGCDNGTVYDLTGRVPRALYEIKGGRQIDWLEMYRGVLCVSDDEGGLTVIDADGSERWQRRDKKAREGWMVRADGTGLWHGSMAGLRKYAWDGTLEWTVDTFDDVRFGWPDGDELVIISGYNTRKDTTIHAITRAGVARVSWPVTTNDGDYQHEGAESCGAARTPDGALRMFVSAGDMLFCVDGDTGAPLWEARTNIGTACTMQSDGERLYVVTTTGVIACIDVSATAIAAAAKGSVPKARVATSGRVAAAETGIEETSDATKGVVLECIKEGSKLRVRVVSKGYHADWYCQFPRDLRVDGGRFVVDELREATQGGFYRVLGDIRRLVSTSS